MAFHFQRASWSEGIPEQNNRKQATWSLSPHITYHFRKKKKDLVVFTIPDRASSESLDSMAPIVSLLSFLLKRKTWNSRCLFDKMVLHLQYLDPKHLMLSDQWHFYLGHEMIFGREKREFLESPLPVHCKTRPLNPHAETRQGTSRPSAVTACNAAEDNHILCVCSCISTSQWAIWSAQGLHNCKSNCQSFLGHVGPCAHYFSSSYISGAVFQGRKHMPS